MLRRLIPVCCCLPLIAACSDDLPDAKSSTLPPTPGPGETAWDDDDITCDNKDDCNAGEVCAEGRCEIQRCASASYSSVPPLGRTLYFQRDQEIVVSRTGASAPRIETYEAVGTTFVSPDNSSLWATGAEPADLAGGNFLGTAPQVVAIAQAAKKAVRFVSDEIEEEMPMGFFPTAIAGGDIDVDGVDELGAVNAVGQFAICNALDQTCSHTGRFEDLVGFDVHVFDTTMADFDGDGLAELAFVGWPKTSQEDFVVGIYNPDSEDTGQPQMVHATFPGNGKRISAADLDGDRVADLFVLDIGAFGDKFHWIQKSSETLSQTATIDLESSGLDILAADTDSDDRAEVMVLTEGDKVEVYSTSGTAGLTLHYSTGLSMTQGANRLAVLDRDGDSPAGLLEDGPNLVPGNLVPISAAIYPPYYPQYSDGTASVAVGNSETMSETASETVSMGASLTVTLGGAIPGVMSGSVGGRIKESVEQRRELTSNVVMWDFFTMNASPAVEGLYNGGVMVGCGCFHTYKYRVEDPAAKLEGIGDRMEVYVPLDGQTHVMSIKRYNAMAEVQGLPIINVPYRIGDPSSYPTEPETLDGEVIPQEDLVFDPPKTYRVSDTADVRYWYLSGESETNAVSTSVEAAAIASAEFSLGIKVGVSGEVTAGYGVGYSITVGKAASFSGEVPPIRDDPNTPEDEFGLYSYSFSPVIYRQHYTDPKGNPSGYYVQTFTVGP